MKTVRMILISLALVISMMPMVIFADDSPSDSEKATSDSVFMAMVGKGEVTLGANIDIYDATLIIENDTIINLNGYCLNLDNPIVVQGGATLTVNGSTPPVENYSTTGIRNWNNKNIFELNGDAALNLNGGEYVGVIVCEPDDNRIPSINVSGKARIGSWEYLDVFVGNANIAISSCQSYSKIERNWVVEDSTLLVEDYGDSKNYLVVDDSAPKSDEYTDLLGLNKDGCMELSCVHPTEYDSLWWPNDEIILSADAEQEGYGLQSVVESYNAEDDTIYIKLSNYEKGLNECHKVRLIFKGDLPENAETKAKLEKAASKIPNVKTYGAGASSDDNLPKYSLTDMELFNLWLACESTDDDSQVGGPYRWPLMFSDEFKKAISYTNSAFPAGGGRAGDMGQFRIWEKGEIRFIENDITFVKKNYISDAVHILYVPTGTKEQDFLKVGQERLDAKFGKGKIKIEKAGTIEAARLEYYRDNRAMPESVWEEAVQSNPENFDYEAFYANWNAMTDEEWDEKCKEYYTNQINGNFDEELNFEFFDDDTVEPTTICYKATINGITHYFRIKPAKRGQTLSDETLCKSIDTMSGVGVSTSANIPLDTKVSVEELSGENAEKQRIDEILKGKLNSDGETYDISMIAGDGVKIERLEGNDKFKVSIPLSDELKDSKNLVVYYVDSKGAIQAYKVTVEGSCAVFYTNHFSAYTLGESKDDAAVSDEPDAQDHKTESKTQKDATGETTSSPNNPKTSDNSDLAMWIVLALIATGAFGGMVVKRRR